MDAADFTIVGGELRFKSPPDFENPTDRDERADTTTGTPEGAGDNIYRVTVRFGAGGEDGMPPFSQTTMMGMTWASTK